MMKFSPELIPATFVKRYKRFFVDAVLEDGTEVVAHCPNTGSMKGLLNEGAGCWLTHNPDPKRKLHYTLELLEAPSGSLVGVHTGRPNGIVRVGIEVGKIAELTGYSELLMEQKYGKNSRIDILLRDGNQPDCYVEVKNVTLAEKEIALFPDAVTTRGTKHLLELAEMVKQGQRAVMVFLVNRGDCTSLKPADDIDAVYGETLRAVLDAGVEALAYDCEVTPLRIHVRQRLDIHL